MARYSEDVIQNVIEANDIVDVISQYVTLKKSGRGYMGRCPFHNEKTPSFSVSSEKQFYHCFGCGVGGDVINFVKEIENLSFTEALQFLADRANIRLPQVEAQNDEAYQKKEQYYEINRNLANYYYLMLKHDPRASEYAADRQIDAQTIRQFGLGYAPRQWRTALQYLTSKGFDKKALIETGIVIENDKKDCYDRFRDRLMIPIINTRGKIIGFGGRVIEKDEKGPKYLNSPESEIFSKGKELFNLNNAKKNIENRQIIVVEGYMDVIALYQYGIKNVVAALGTAFTLYHATVLSRYADEVVLCFDGDAAGEKATQRAIEILGGSTLAIKVVRLNEEDDPDSYIRKNGVEAYRNQIAQAMTVVEYQLAYLKKHTPQATNDDKIKYINQAIPIIMKAETPAEIELYSKIVAREAEVSPRIIFNAVMRLARDKVPVPEDIGRNLLQRSNEKIPKAYLESQEMIITGIINHTLAMDQLACDASYFSEGLWRTVYELLEEAGARQATLTVPMIFERLTKEEQEQLSAVLMKGDSQDGADWQLSLATLTHYHNVEQMKKIKQQLSTLASDDAESVKLLNQLTQLKKQIGDVQEE